VLRIWEFGNYYIACSDKDKKVWKYALCSRVYIVSLINNNSLNVIRHLDERHQVNLSKTGAIVAVRQQHGNLLASLNVLAFRQNLLTWLVTRQQSFREVEDNYF